MNNKEQINLVQKAVAGDKQAFGELYREKSTSLFYHAMQILGNMQDAEDVIQNVALDMYNNLHTLRKPESFNAWVHSIVVKECNQMFRKKYIKNQKIDSLENYENRELGATVEFLPQDHIENKELKNDLVKAIQNLPMKYRSALVMYYYEEMSYAEIAKVLDIPINTVRTNLSRAKEAINKEISAKYQTSENAISGLAGFALLRQTLTEQVQALVQHSGVGLSVEAAISEISMLPLPQSTAFVAAAVPSFTAVKALITGGILAAITFAAVMIYPYLSSEAEPAGGPQPAVGSVMVEDLKGTVLFEDHGGNLITETGIPFEELEVQLFDDTGTEISKTTVNESGNFAFEEHHFESGKTYSLKVISENFIFAIASGEATHMRAAFTPYHKQDFEGVFLHISVNETPQGTIVASGGNGTYAYEAPSKIEFLPEKVALKQSNWEIQNEETGQTVQTGEGTSITSILTVPAEKLPHGEYVAIFRITDVFGNMGVIKFAFVM